MRSEDHTVEVEATPDGGDLAAWLPRILATAGVAAVRLEAMVRPESFRGGDVSPEVQEVTSAAREEHRRYGFGFWEFALNAATSVPSETRKALISGALRHTTGDAAEAINLPLEVFARRLASGDFTQMPRRTIVSLCSHVPQHAGAHMHLPMLDFSAPTGQRGIDTVRDVALQLGLPGGLFDSGKSFHFFGSTLLSERELSSFLARAQLLSPIVDARWASHQLLDMECRLRISTDVERNTSPHRLIALIK